MIILHLLGSRKLPRDPEQESASGVVRVALELAREQVRSGHEVTVATVAEQSWRTRWAGVRLLQLATWPRRRLELSAPLAGLRRHLPYIWLTHREHFDVVHGHLYAYLRFLRAGARVAHFHADPLYRGTDGSRQHYSAADFARVARSSDAQVAVSHFVAGRLRDGLRPSGQVFVVPNGVEAARFAPLGCAAKGQVQRAAWGVAEGDVVFLYAGAVVPEKGVLPLARAFTRLSARYPQLHLAVVGSSNLWGSTHGEGPNDVYQLEVQAVLDPALRAGQAHWVGKVGAAEMPTVYAAADVVVVPSLWPEPAALVLLEAFAAGRPVIATCTGGTPELVSDQTGRLVPPDDEEALTQAMLGLAENTTGRMKLGERAQGIAQSRSWNAVAQRLETVYQAAGVS